MITSKYKLRRNTLPFLSSLLSLYPEINLYLEKTTQTKHKTPQPTPPNHQKAAKPTQKTPCQTKNNSQKLLLVTKKKLRRLFVHCSSFFTIYYVLLYSVHPIFLHNQISAVLSMPSLYLWKRLVLGFFLKSWIPLNATK